MGRLGSSSIGSNGLYDMSGPGAQKTAISSGVCGAEAGDHPPGRLLASRAPKDRINTRILQNMVSGITLIWGLGTRM